MSWDESKTRACCTSGPGLQSWCHPPAFYYWPRPLMLPLCTMSDGKKGQGRHFLVDWKGDEVWTPKWWWSIGADFGGGGLVALLHCSLLCPGVFSCFYDCLVSYHLWVPFADIFCCISFASFPLSSRVFVVGPHCGSLIGSRVTLLEKVILCSYKTLLNIIDSNLQLLRLNDFKMKLHLILTVHKHTWELTLPCTV